MSASEVLDGIKRMSDEYATTLDADGDWSPMLFAETKDGMNLIGLDNDFMANEMTKDLLADVLMPNFGKDFGPLLSMTFLASTWQVEKPEGEVPDGYYDIRPSMHPRRFEALVLLYCSPTEERVAIGRIKRGRQSPWLEWQDLEESAAIEGRFIGGLRRAVWG